MKSDGFASSLSSPAGEHSLGDYCARHGVAYDDLAIPVKLETFINYGSEFQQRFVPTIDQSTVVGLSAGNGGFELRVDSGKTFKVRQVILAVGIMHFAYMPPELETLPVDLASHSSVHHNVDNFKNRDVTVIGAGASAIDLAALLHEAGANVRVIARRSSICFGSVPKAGDRSKWQKIRHPQSGLGPGLRSRLACDLPDFFRFIPASLRLKIVREHLGPASAWHLKSRVVGRFPLLLGSKVADVTTCGSGLQLGIQSSDGSRLTVMTDHVIAATGYRVDVDRLHFIDEKLRSRVRRIGGMPILSRNFELSVPGLYFVGIAAAGSFGPLMQFVYGCDLAAHRVSRHTILA